MAKNGGKHSYTPTTNAVSNGTAQTAKTFSITNVEKDIYMGKSTKAIADKYGKSPKDVITLVERAYCRSASKVRELKKRLENADEAETRRAVAQFKAEEEKRLSTTPQMAPVIKVKPETVEPKVKETPITLQRKRVNEAQDKLNAARDAVTEVDTQLRAAVKAQSEAAKALRAAQQKKEDADDAVRSLESRKASAEMNREVCKKCFEAENELLTQLCSQPKLMHASAFKTERGRIEGRVYVSQWDYDHMDDSMKGLVIPVRTDGISLKAYPKDFFRYPTMMGMDAYQSACECALAFMKLREGEDGDKLELICSDDTVTQLVNLQEVSQ